MLYCVGLCPIVLCSSLSLVRVRVRVYLVAVVDKEETSRTHYLRTVSRVRCREGDSSYCYCCGERVEVYLDERASVVDV